MSKYIEREALKAEFMKHYACEYSAALVMAIIDNVSTADVAEVRHGKWRHEYLECSVCQRNISEIYDADSYMAYGIEDELKYCPYCGAKMDLE